MLTLFYLLCAGEAAIATPMFATRQRLQFVGIDVAKAALDVFIGSAGMAFTVANNEVRIRDLIRQLWPTDFVILEATGGLETPLASALAAAGSQRRSLIRTRCDTHPRHSRAGQDRPAKC